MTPRPGPCVQTYTAHGSVLLQNHFWSHMEGTDKLQRHSLRPARAYSNGKYEKEAICTWQSVPGTWTSELCGFCWHHFL